MENCLVTKFKGTVQNNNLPIMLPDGTVVDVFTGKMYNKMQDFNFTPDSDELSAATAFIASGKEKGWLDYIKYFLPIIGDNTHPFAACVPLIDKIHNYEVLQNPITGGNEANAFSYNSENKIIGLGSLNDSTANRAMKLPVRTSDMGGGLCCIVTGNLQVINNGGLYAIVDGTDNTSVKVSARFMVPSGNKRLQLVDIDNNVSDSTTNIPNMGDGEWSICTSLYLVDEQKKTYIFRHKLNIATATITKDYSQATNFRVPFDDSNCVFLLGGGYNRSSNVNELIRNFTVFDPSIPEDILLEYSKDVFTFNASLGRYE